MKDAIRMRYTVLLPKRVRNTHTNANTLEEGMCGFITYKAGQRSSRITQDFPSLVPANPTPTQNTSIITTPSQPVQGIGEGFSGL
ncbi:hypothetical protein E2C01_062572 [Portunus trituberculatus]|uniref:Uncharacterized protein n=1 Tax=Portunus trituberculatus TaxID=210409 RepID=A0A5B7H6R2_PORTR|nr:hypothetical protein [Portunus trituberculatus]